MTELVDTETVITYSKIGGKNWTWMIQKSSQTYEMKTICEDKKHTGWNNNRLDIADEKIRKLEDNNSNLQNETQKERKESYLKLWPMSQIQPCPLLSYCLWHFPTVTAALSTL